VGINSAVLAEETLETTKNEKCHGTLDGCVVSRLIGYQRFTIVPRTISEYFPSDTNT
jgi:hypothetical protein